MCLLKFERKNLTRGFVSHNHPRMMKLKSYLSRLFGSTTVPMEPIHVAVGVVVAEA